MIGKRRRIGRPLHNAALSALAIMLFASCMISPVLAQNQVTIGASKDNTLYEDATGALSNGAGGSFFVGRVNLTGQTLIRRGLIAFDVAGNVPTGATILSLTLRLNMSQTISGTQTIALHRALADWGEGTSVGSGSGAPSTPGDATWIHTFFNTSFWSSAGGDFAAAPSATQQVSGLGVYTWASTPALVSDAQAWLDSASTNFGWVVLGNESTFPTSKRFDTRENSVPGARPMLTINYTPPVGVEDDVPTPAAFALHQNYPNPFNPTTTIRYDVPKESHVLIKVCNLLGHEVKTLVDELQSPGMRSVTWDARDRFGSPVASGVYVYRIYAGAVVQNRKMILLK